MVWPCKRYWDVEIVETQKLNAVEADIYFSYLVRHLYSSMRVLSFLVPPHLSCRHGLCIAASDGCRQKKDPGRWRAYLPAKETLMNQC